MKSTSPTSQPVAKSLALCYSTTMAESASIQKMSHRHEAIMNFMLANPLLKLSEVAGEFNVTQAWLSTIIHSHAFQDQLSKRKNEIFDVAVLQELGDKLGAAAHQTIDAYLEKVPTLSADQLIAAQDKLLGRLGYGTRAAQGNTIVNGNIVQNVQNNHVAKDILEEARHRIGTHKVGETSDTPALQDQSAEKGLEIKGSEVREESQPLLVGRVRSD